MQNLWKQTQTDTQIWKKGRQRFCENVQDEIFIFYGLDILSDTDDHPKVMCCRCYNKMKKAKVFSDNSKLDDVKFLGEKEKAKIVNKTWITRKRHNCTVCMLYNSQQKRGRPEKTKKSGRPKNAETVT